MRERRAWRGAVGVCCSCAIMMLITLARALCERVLLLASSCCATQRVTCTCCADDIIGKSHRALVKTVGAVVLV